MPESGSEVILYAPCFKERVAALQTSLWSPDTRLNRQYLEWKYERNPYVTTPLIYLAVRDGDVLGMRGFYGACWELGEPTESRTIPCAGDFCVAAEHQGSGLHSAIMAAALPDLAERGYPYVFSLSAGRVTRAASLLTGWKSGGGVEVLELCVPAAADSIARPSETFARWDEVCAGPWSLAGGSAVPSREPRPEEMADLAARLRRDDRACHVHDRQFFAWRFENPLSQHRFLFYERDGLEGYVVLAASTWRVEPRVNLLAWQAADAEVATELLRAVIARGGFARLLVWSRFLSESRQRSLVDAGFVDADPKPGLRSWRPRFMVRPTEEQCLDSEWIIAGKRLLDLDGWDLQMLDSDGY
jgi:GNAT superfamily N-acetyltransferase